METKIKIESVDDLELYHRYPRQTSAQDCFVELDCRYGKLRATYDGEIGGAVPFAVYHGHVRRYHLPAPIRGEVANALLDQIAELAQRVVDGYESEWDGNNNVARLDDDATAADDEIERLVGDVDVDQHGITAWDAGDWLDGLGSYKSQASELGITAQTTDEEIEAIGEQLEKEAKAADVDILEGLGSHLDRLRETMREAEEE